VTANATDIDNQVRQLDLEVQSIYEMLARIQGTQTRHRHDEVLDLLRGRGD
jgi:hypothetical protein